MQEAQFAKYAPPLNPNNAEACEIWNLMGGLDWAALPMVLTLHPVDDVDGLIRRLVRIREGTRA